MKTAERRAGEVAAVILAAGRGSRLLPHTQELPKCLLDLGGESILGFQLRQFLAAGIDRVVVITGYRADLVSEACAPFGAVQCIENHDYATTNSLYSLGLAADALTGCEFVLANGDVICHPQVLVDLLAHPAESALTFDPSSGRGEEEMKVRVVDGHVAEISKAMPESRSNGENLGLLRFGEGGGGALFAAAARLVESGEGGNWAPRAYNEVIRTHPIAVVSSGSWPWIEIDTPADLERARRDVFPRVRSAELRPVSGRLLDTR